ncbi:MAG: hypothetical protein IT519_02885 [Burkholderiales bacterium]|jgi:hypothetical protein|nr:hypothetical protein [Burkholderiales bacterium]
MRILLALVLATIVTPVSAQANSAFFLVQVPTLDEVGLGALIALVAGAAGWAARKHSKRR